MANKPDTLHMELKDLQKYWRLGANYNAQRDKAHRSKSALDETSYKTPMMSMNDVHKRFH